MKARKILRIVFTIFWTPALIFHEFSHYAAYLMFFKIPDDIKLTISFNKPLSGIVYKKKPFKNKYIKTVISLAPLLFYLIFIVLAFFIPYFWPLPLYLTLAFMHTLPSNGDVNAVLSLFEIDRTAGDYRNREIITRYLFPELKEAECALVELSLCILFENDNNKKEAMQQEFDALKEKIDKQFGFFTILE